MIKADKVVQLSLDAGKILLQKKKKLKSLKTNYKKNEGLVSEADYETEIFLRDKISKLTPDFFILSEEDSYENKKNFTLAKKSEYCWHIDPLDGTNNYLSGLDHYAISIGLSRGDELILGVIYAPERQEIYWAEKGKGAFWKKIGMTKKNQMKASSYMKKDFEKAFFVTCLNSLGGKNKKKLDAFYRVNNEALSVRRFGSAALDLCYTGRGLFDGFWEHGLKPWDINAGALICQEAGVIVTDFWKGDFHPYSETIVAVREHLADQLYRILKPIFKNS